MIENIEAYNRLKQANEDLKKLHHYVEKHEKTRDEGYKLDYETKIQDILDKYSSNNSLPEVGSKWITKKDVYRYNLDFRQGQMATVEEIRIGKDTSVVVIINSYQKIIKLKDFNSLFTKKGE